jgi:glycopeptide antibiotics resistance protein
MVVVLLAFGRLAAVHRGGNIIMLLPVLAILPVLFRGASTRHNFGRLASLLVMII